MPQKTKKTKKSFSEFATKPKSNAGVKLTIPDTNGQWVKVLGIDSDVFREASIQIVRSTKDNPSEDKLTEEQIDQKAQDNRLKLLTACVVDWSFSEKCTPANIKKMIEDAPLIASFIDNEVGNRANFLGKL